MTHGPTALVLDFGGVLTNDFWEVLRSYARRDGLPEDALVDLVTKNPDGVELLRNLEKGAYGSQSSNRKWPPNLACPDPAYSHAWQPTYALTKKCLP